MKCTWVGCEAEAKFPQISSDGKTEWANLCDLHHKEIDGALDSFDAKRILSNWVKAQGGAKAAAGRMMR